MNLFTPVHVQLLNACYPPSSARQAAGHNYAPNSQELSRLTYHASNHPSKLSKLGAELEKRVRNECKKTRSGSTRARPLLLISLAILRALAMECRRDIALLSSSLVASVHVVVTGLPDDMEVTASAASVFTSWTTYTDGHVIGADASVTEDYISTLRQFATLTRKENSDQEKRDRTRLIGLAALTGAISSEALYNDITQFRSQVQILVNPLLYIIFKAPIDTLDDQAATVKETPISPYLTGFRTRPALERRAASIHVHIDGEKGPSMSDVVNAALHALYCLLDHASGPQLSYIVHSSCDSLDELGMWIQLNYCSWYANKVAEWSQYQNRQAVPTWLVEHLVGGHESSASPARNLALTAMITAVFNSPIAFASISTSDILSNLLGVLTRWTNADVDEETLSGLAKCVASLGRHVYYSDQIVDLIGELIGRLVTVETQGVVAKDKPEFMLARSKAILCLIASLLGLLRAANGQDPTSHSIEMHPASSPSSRTSVEGSKKDHAEPRTHRRTHVPPDVWQDTLSLLCDADPSIRANYTEALIFYIEQEMPKREPPVGSKVNGRYLSPFHYSTTGPLMLRPGDNEYKLLSVTHAYLYVLATSTRLGLISSSSASPSHSFHEDASAPLTDQVNNDLHHRAGSPAYSQYGRRSVSVARSRSRKVSLVRRLLDHAPSHISSTTSATIIDYSYIVDIITTLLQQMPVQGLLTGVPMILALELAAQSHDVMDTTTIQRVQTVKEAIAKIWLTIAQTWNANELVALVEQELSTLPRSNIISGAGRLKLSETPEADLSNGGAVSFWVGVNSETALSIVTSNSTIQHATGMDGETLSRRLSAKWAPNTALTESNERSAALEFKRDGVLPLLKISSALMQIENKSLQSLARSTGGVGVTDLREALEGRSSLSNPNLARPPSLSTLDHASSVMGGELNRLARTRSMSRQKKKLTPGTGEVRDVLNRLGIGKAEGALLKAPLPMSQDQSKHASHSS